MSGSSLDGLDIAFVEFQEQGGKWTYEILEADCIAYSDEWVAKLKDAINLSARDYQLLHSEYGHYTGLQVNKFIDEHQLHFKVAVIASHGHTTFHMPDKKMTAQLGDGAAIAAETKLPVVSDLRSLDVAFGGQGAPIVPIGEKMLMSEYDYFLNIGGIANISFSSPSFKGEGGRRDDSTAFDVCPANRVLNMLVNELGMEYDEGGQIAASGTVNEALLEKLNGLDYYKLPYPKSLANDFGTDIVYPIIKQSGLEIKDAVRTYVEHIVVQIRQAINTMKNPTPDTRNPRLLTTGGGAFNTFLIQRLSDSLKQLEIDVIVPDKKLVNFKEAIIMAFIGVLRWRQENNVLSSVTGAVQDSIGGALWIGQEA
jgi:anhydro-N-acetylmuramic acid kinase